MFRPARETHCAADDESERLRLRRQDFMRGRLAAIFLDRGIFDVAERADRGLTISPPASTSAPIEAAQRARARVQDLARRVSRRGSCRPAHSPSVSRLGGEPCGTARRDRRASRALQRLDAVEREARASDRHPAIGLQQRQHRRRDRREDRRRSSPVRRSISSAGRCGRRRGSARRRVRARPARDPAECSRRRAAARRRRRRR